jgi:hypothetical protein
LGRWRILEVLLKMVALFFACFATGFLAAFIDELVLKPLIVVPADHLASGHTAPADQPVSPQANKPNEPSDGSGLLLGNAFNTAVVLGTLISTISALAAGWAFVITRVRTILKLLRQPG